jgi:uncharacterized protein
MRIRSCILALVVVANVLFSPASRADDPKPRVLMLSESKGFVHQPVKRMEGELSASEVAMRQLAIESGKFTLELSQDASTAITRENLQNFDVVMFYTSGNLPITDDNMAYFLDDWLKQPKHGMVGVHSSTDTLKNNRRYVELIGGAFAGHPWSQNTNVVIKVHEPTHPTVAAFGDKIELKEEIYQYSNWVPENVRVLMSLEMANCEVKRPNHVPVAWVKSWGQGRLYYNNMGHRPDTWQNKKFMQSMLDGILWAAGQTEGPTASNPELSAQQEVIARKAAADAGVTEESLAAEAATKAKAKEKNKEKAATK